MLHYVEENQEVARQGFKHLNRLMLLMWRLGLGEWLNMAPATLGRYIVIAHTGRKTGFRRFAPVNYALIDGDVYCVAGFGTVSHWYQNIMALPDVEVWMAEGRWRAHAEDVTDTPDALSKVRQVLIGSGFVSPLLGVHPRTMSDEELAAITRDYRLIRLCREQAVTGAGGPGELAWVWWVIGFFVLLALRPRKHRKQRQSRG